MQPLALALLDASGYKDKLVYFGYSNHVWEQHRGQTEKVFLVGGKMLTQTELMDRTMQVRTLGRPCRRIVGIWQTRNFQVLNAFCVCNLAA